METNLRSGKFQVTHSTFTVLSNIVHVIQLDHDNDGTIPLHELRATLADAAINTHIPSNVIDYITALADKNNDGVLNFAEFMALVRTHELTLLYPNLNRAMKSAAFVVVPRSERSTVMRTYLEEYKCCPPPLMMPLLSLVEVLRPALLFKTIAGVHPI